MDDFLKMDIFFFVATVAVVVVSACAALVLWRLQRILRHIEHISGQISAESEAIRLDIADMRTDVRSKGLIRSLSHFLIKAKKRSDEAS